MRPAPARLLLAGICCAFGCASYSSFKEARALEPSAFRVDVAGTVITALPASGATAYLRGARPFPTDDSQMAKTKPALELQVRYGIARGFDLGLKTNLSSLELNGTVEIVRGARFDLALAPVIRVDSYSFNIIIIHDEGWRMTTLKLPLLADIRFGSAGQHALIFGPAIARAWGTGTDRNSGYSIGAVLAGGTVGLSLANGPDFRIFPEVAIYTTVAGHGIALPGGALRVCRPMWEADNLSSCKRESPSLLAGRADVLRC